MKAKKILITLLVALVMCSMSVNVFAATEILDDIKPNRDAGANVTNLGNEILGIIQVVGTIAAVGILMILGIKYMMGSTEEKAEYKKTMLPYIIGAVLLFAAVNIAGVVANMAGSVTGA